MNTASALRIAAAANGHGSGEIIGPTLNGVPNAEAAHRQARDVEAALVDRQLGRKLIDQFERER